MNHTRTAAGLGPPSVNACAAGTHWDRCAATKPTRDDVADVFEAEQSHTQEPHAACMFLEAEHHPALCLAAVPEPRYDNIAPGLTSIRDLA